MSQSCLTNFGQFCGQLLLFVAFVLVVRIQGTVVVLDLLRVQRQTGMELGLLQ